jgi:hypothetical protein
MSRTEFFRKYANMPLNRRFEIIQMNDFGELTWSGLYFQLKKLDDDLRNMELNNEGYQTLKIIEDKYWNTLNDLDKIGVSSTGKTKQPNVTGKVALVNKE